MASTSLVVSALGGCDGSIEAHGGSDGGATGRDAGPRADGGPVGPSDPFYADCGGRIFDPETGLLDADEYDRQAHLWNRDVVDCRLGPHWDEVHAGEPDERPTLFEPAVDASRVCGADGAFQTYEYGPSSCAQTCPDGGLDYLSTSMQLGYVPDDTSLHGVDRLTSYGVAGLLVATRPQFAPPRISAHPDEDLLSPLWPERGFRRGDPVAIVRSHLTGGYRGHQAIAAFADGFVGGMGTITDGVSGGLAPLQVGFRFPDNLVPTDVAISAHSELAFVTLWDTDAHVGRLGVFAMQSNFPLFDLQTWWYVGLPSSGAFTAMKYLGSIELPMATPTSLAVATNGIQANGPHATGGRRLGEFGLISDGACDPDVAALFSVEGESVNDLANIVATHGYAIVASRWEHRVALVDLRPLLQGIRQAYFEDMDFCNEHVVPAHVWTGESEGLGGNPGTHQFDGEDRWPFPFERSTEGPTLPPPVVAATFELDAPVDVEAGYERSAEPPRAFVLQADGHVQVIYPERLFHPLPSTSAMATTAEPRLGPAVDVCDHPTTITLANSHSSFVLTCRGDRRIEGYALAGEVATNTLAIEDALLDDPVATELNDRGPVLTVADFAGRQVVNYVLGDIAFSCASVPLATPGVVQCGGRMPIEGTPFLLSGANVN